jgi:hypothetical protein
MKKLFLAISIAISVNAIGQIHKATGDKPYGSNEYIDYYENDSTYYRGTIFAYNANKQIVNEIITYNIGGNTDTIVRNYDAKNRIVSLLHFDEYGLNHSKIWKYDEPKRQIDYYELYGNEYYSDTVYHIKYEGVNDFDNVDEHFSGLLTFFLSNFLGENTNVEIRNCANIFVNYYDYNTSSWELATKIQPKYQSGRPNSVKVEPNVKRFEEIIKELSGFTVSNLSLTLTPTYNGNKLTKIGSLLIITTDASQYPVPISDFIVLKNQYNGDLLTETKIELNINVMGMYEQYLGGNKRTYSYNSDNNVSCEVTEVSEDETDWEIVSKIYYHYSNVGINDINAPYIAVSQNIPNPASDFAMFNYTVPTTGKVQFTIYNISGQVLLVHTEEAKSGENCLKLSFSHLASGMYFYAMEFDGKKTVKKMSVEK